MELDRAFLIVCLTVAVVVLFNIMIYLSLRRGQGVTTVDMMRKAARRARNPWQDEDEALEELSKIVAGLKSGERPKKSAQKSDHGDDQ